MTRQRRRQLAPGVHVPQPYAKIFACRCQSRARPVKTLVPVRGRDVREAWPFDPLSLHPRGESCCRSCRTRSVCYPANTPPLSRATGVPSKRRVRGRWPCSRASRCGHPRPRRGSIRRGRKRATRPLSRARNLARLKVPHVDLRVKATHHQKPPVGRVSLIDDAPVGSGGIGTDNPARCYILQNRAQRPVEKGERAAVWGEVRNTAGFENATITVRCRSAQAERTLTPPRDLVLGQAIEPALREYGHTQWPVNPAIRAWLL